MLLINRRITRRDLARDINAVIGTEIVHALSRGCVDLARHDHDHHDQHNQDDQDDQDDHDDGDNAHDSDNDNGYHIPEWVADRVNKFVLNAGMYPFVKEIPQQGMGGLNKRLVGVAIAGRGAALRSVTKDQEGEEEYAYSWAVAKWTDESVQEVAGRVQEFYGALEREVRDRRSRARMGEEAGGERKRGNSETDGVVSQVVEAVEGVVSSLFYDRWGFELLVSSWEMG